MQLELLQGRAEDSAFGISAGSDLVHLVSKNENDSG